MNLKFDHRYALKTSYGDMNFIGAAIHYFEKINKDNMESTKDNYISYYNNSIFPNVDITKPIKEYTPEYVENLIWFIQKEKNLNESTIYSIIDHLIYDPCIEYFLENNPSNNPFEISPSDFRDADLNIDKNVSLLKITKSLTIEEEKKAHKILFNDFISVPGEYIGLALMFYTAVRNNEACGLNYGDIIEMSEHPGCYYLQVTKTTMINSNRLKAGGKTYNAPRRLPIVTELKSFLLNRMNYLSHFLHFPFTKNGIKYNSVLDLPIVCRGDNYTQRCSAADLTKVGKCFLSQQVGISKNRMAGLEMCIYNDVGTDFDLGEKDVTTYVLRRNMATHLYVLGLSEIECQYYMGHKIEKTSLKRTDFNNERLLYEIWRKIQNHPLNKENAVQYPIVRIEDQNFAILDNLNNVEIELKSGTYLVKAINREVGDVMNASFEGHSCQISVEEATLPKSNHDTMNVNKLMQSMYERRRR